MPTLQGQREWAHSGPGRLLRVSKASLLSWTYIVLRLGLAIPFIYGGFTKLLSPKVFAKTLSAYGLVPEELLPLVAIGLPLIETVAGTGLVFDIKGSLALISGLLSLFVFVLWYGVLHNLEIDCGCFGAEEVAGIKNLTQALYRDLGLMGVAAFLYLARWIGPRVGVPVRNK